MREFENNVGRLRYFDPNATVLENREGTYSDSITFPYEDYNMAVDLQIRVFNRYSCGLGDMTGEMKSYEYSTKNGTLSFLGGTDGILTTNYTDISMVNPSGNTSECLGIESIQVTYDSWLHPTVNIVFIDVRGGTVMQPAESHYYNDLEEGSNYQIYRALFSFPYPLFLLKVKGFYGRGVTYRLAVNRTDIEFDASSGNFKISVDFIGHIYGLFADIPMTYIAIAPYTEEGNRYWEQKVSDKTFWFYSMSSSGEPIEKSPMIKFPELALRAAEVAFSQPAAKIKADTQKTLQDLDSEIESLNGIVTEYRNIFENNSNVVLFEDGKVFPYFSYIAYFGNGNLFGNDGEKEAFNSFIEHVKNHDTSYGTSYEYRFGRLSSFVQNSWLDSEKYVKYKRNENGTFEFDGYAGWVTKKELTYGDSKLTDIFDLTKNPDLGNFLKNSSKIEGIPVDNVKIYAFRNSGEKIGDIINNKIPENIKKIQKSKEISEKEGKEKQVSYIEDALGFRPSIKNMYDLAFAHLDTFMHVYYETLKKIRMQLEKKGDERKKITYSLTDDLTDCERSSGINLNQYENNFVRGDFLPPFAGIYKYMDDADNYTKKRTMMWPGDLPNGDSSLEEVKFIFDLLNGSKLYFERSEEVNFEIEKFRSSGSTNVSSGRHPMADVKNFIPLTVYDIANNGYVANPYSSIALKIKNEVDIDEIIGDVYGIFSLRLFYYMNSFDSGKNTNTNEAAFFGRLDAINFFKAVGKSESTVLYKFLSEFADGEDMRKDRKKFEDAITYGDDSVDSKTKMVKSWRIDSSSGTNRSLFTRSGKVYRYSYSKTDTVECSNGVLSVKVPIKYFPVKIEGMNELKKSFSNGFPRNNEGFISSISHEAYSGTTDGYRVGKTMNGGTFLLYETRDYIKNLYKNIEDELNQEKSENGNSITDEDINAIKAKSTFKGFSNNIDSSVKPKIRKYAIEKTKSDEKLSIDEMIKNGSLESMDSYQIVHPDAIDDARNQNQLDANGETSVRDARSVLETPLYWLQDNVYAKAMLFIQGALITDGILGMEYKNNSVVQRASLLREGSTYWYHDNYDLVKTEGHCKFKYSIDKDGNCTEIEGDYKFKKPNQNQMFISNYSENGDGINDNQALIYDNFETYNPIPYDSNAQYYDTPYYGGIKQKETKDVSKSRVEYLKKYFESWVENEFAPVLDCYEDITLYGDKERRKYGDGLDISLVTGAMSSGESNRIPRARKLQECLKGVYFNSCTIFDYYGGFYNNVMSVKESVFTSGFRAFMKQLRAIYGDMADATQNEINDAFAKKYAEDPFRNKDLRLSTYMTLKSLYDKWICSSLKGEKTWRFNRTDFEHNKRINSDRNYYNAHRGEYELDNFIYVDSFYRDIGYDLTINLTKFVDWIGKCLPTSDMHSVEGIMSYNSKTLYEFLTDIAIDCGAILLAIPQRFMFDCGENIKKVFTPIPSCQDWDDDTYTYMFLYNYKPSEHLGTQEPTNIDMNGWSPEGDGFDLTDKDIVGELFDENDIGYGVPAFGVTFAKQNQSYFKNISLTTKQHGVTEAGLNATFQIAAKSSETVRETTLYGQDIYKVFSNNSYECTVEMMGNMQIFPPMYFQLNNIPMWRGAYMIKKVTHSIRPGDITTTFVGVKQNKYLIPMANATIASLGTNEKRNSSSESNNETVVSELSVFVDGSQGIGVKQIPQNLGKNISEDADLDKDDISPTKPIICITPAHSTTHKALEHSWSTKIVDNYIIPKLKRQTFMDGTSYEKHVFRGGRTNRPNRESNSYDLDPVRHLISKYGSNCVVSVVPHWNGAHGQYYMAIYGKINEGSCTKYINEEGKEAYKDCTASMAYFRADSRKFGEFFRAAANEAYSKRDTYSTMPNGMMDGGITTEKNGPLKYLLKPDNTDPAPMVNCSCVLTENFFADYSVNSVSWQGPDYDKKDSEGRYQTGRAWLESEEGLNVISDIHVNAIVNYINSLKENTVNPPIEDGQKKQQEFKEKIKEIQNRNMKSDKLSGKRGGKFGKW